MPYTTLRRKTPLKRTGWKKKAYPWARNPKPRKPMAQKSDNQKARDAKYRKVHGPYLRANPSCKVCLYLGAKDGRGAARATEVHHIRGRNGALLWDTRFFAGTCRGHRDWPHVNPQEARAAGLLALPQDWGVVPRG